MGEAILELINVTKKYGTRKAVDNISLTVNGGEIFGFIGPNGAGKTTTIKLIVGLASITSGEIKVCGYNLKKDFENALKNIGGIIENPELYKFLSGRQNLELFGGLYKGIKKEQIDKVIKLVGLENRIDDRVRKYSLGMKQRLGIAQSLLHNPKILILDEPTNGLDPYGIREMRDLLTELAHNKGLAVFISSHILSEMQLVCDRAAIIDNGKITKVLTLQELNKFALCRYTLKADNPNKAVSVLTEKYPETFISEEGIINVNVSEEDIPDIIKLLVANDIGIYGVKPVSENLESLFLSVTKESRIQKVLYV